MNDMKEIKTEIISQCKSFRFVDFQQITKKQEVKFYYDREGQILHSTLFLSECNNTLFKNKIQLPSYIY